MFKLLQTFRQVYETRSFSHAAELLFISQPAVSNQMKQLETELKCQLFTRKAKQEIIATPEADVLYRQLLNLSDDWRETLRLIKGVDETKITCQISASHTFAVYYLPELMTHLLSAFPNVSFELSMKNSEEVLASLVKHDIAFGFIEKPLTHNQVVRSELLRETLVLAGNLESSFWLSREETSGVYHYMARYMVENNINEEKMCVKSNEMIVKFLEKGIGKSVISSKAITNDIPFAPLGPNYERSFYLLKNERLSHLVHEDISLFIEAYYHKNSETT